MRAHARDGVDTTTTMKRMNTVGDTKMLNEFIFIFFAQKNLNDMPMYDKLSCRNMPNIHEKMTTIQNIII